MEYLLRKRESNLRFNNTVKYQKAQFELKEKFSKHFECKYWWDLNTSPRELISEIVHVWEVEFWLANGLYIKELINTEKLLRTFSSSEWNFTALSNG